MTPEQERVSTMLLDAVVLLCRNSLCFSTELTVQGLIGITMDKSNVFLVHINEQIQPCGTESIKQEQPSVSQRATMPETHFPRKRQKKWPPFSGANQSYQPGVDDGRCDLNPNIKTEVDYKDPGMGYDDFGYLEDANCRPTFGNIKPISVMRQMQVVRGCGSDSTAVASTIVTESYNMLDDGAMGSAMEEEEEEEEDLGQIPEEAESWVADENLFQVVSDHIPVHSTRGRPVWRGSVSAARGSAHKAKLAARGQGRQNTRVRQPMSAPGVGRLKVSASNPYVINETSHLCGYPDCGKRFRFRHDLLRHQTKKHGRTPTPRGRGQRFESSFTEYG